MAGKTLQCCIFTRPGGVWFRRVSLFLVNQFTLCVIILSFLCSPAGYGQGVTLNGTVRDKKSSLPINAARITLYDIQGVTVGAADTNPQGEWSISVVPTETGQTATSISTYSVEQNYPNPFNPSTRIRFTLPVYSRVHVSIHNILGQILDSKSAQLEAGSYSIDWRSIGGAGVLFYTVETEEYRVTKKMIQLDGGSGSGLSGISLVNSAGSVHRALSTAGDVVRVVASSTIHEPDTLTVSLIPGARADFSLSTIHDRAFFVDLHNDALEAIFGDGTYFDFGQRHTIHQTDIPRLLEGGVDAQLFSVWINPTSQEYQNAGYYPSAIRYLDTLNAQIKRNQSTIGIAGTMDSIQVLNRSGKIAAIPIVEGGHCIEDDLNKLHSFYQRGVRLMTITWNNSTTWAVSHSDSRASTVGLSEFGKQVIKTMDSLGMIIDISHVGTKTVEDILAITKNPIVASHSGVYSLRSNTRNLTDNQIKAIAQGGGVIGVVFYPSFLTGTSTATIDNVIQHIDHIKKLVGIDYVAIGSDFDGMGSAHPAGLDDVSKFPALTEALLKKGYSRDEVRKILGENFLRVFKTVCK
ncbi:MAG: membrane dipeptidase [bacterium]